MARVFGNPVSRASASTVNDSLCLPPPPFHPQSINSKRSYIYARENSVETNVAYKKCGLIPPIGNLCCPDAMDYTTVLYYDRDPFQKKTKCCCCAIQPKVETQQSGQMCCCIPLKCCCNEAVGPQLQTPPTEFIAD